MKCVQDYSREEGATDIYRVVVSSTQAEIVVVVTVCKSLEKQTDQQLKYFVLNYMWNERKILVLP